MNEGKTPLLVAQRRHHKAPLRGALMRLEGAARRAAADFSVFLITGVFQTLIGISTPDTSDVTHLTRRDV